MDAVQLEPVDKISDEDFDNYKRNREQVYPVLYSKAHPSKEAERAKETYDGHTTAANIAVNLYQKAYVLWVGDNSSENNPITNLEPYQHRMLVSLAADAAIKLAT